MSRAKLQLKPKSPPAVAPQAPRSPAGDASTRPPSRQGTKLIGGHFPHATWSALRRLGLDIDKTVQALLQEAIDDLLAKHRR